MLLTLSRMTVASSDSVIGTQATHNGRAPETRYWQCLFAYACYIARTLHAEFISKN